jgi:hypothetical protein
MLAGALSEAFVAIAGGRNAYERHQAFHLADKTFKCVAVYIRSSPFAMLMDGLMPVGANDVRQPEHRGA